MKSASRPGLGDVHRQRLQVVGQQRRQRDDVLEVGLDVPLQRVDLEAIFLADGVVGRRHARAQIRPHGRDRLELQARQSLHDQAQAAVGQLEHLVDVRRRADPMQVVLGRLFDRGIPLREHADELAAGDRLFDQAHGALARHGQRQERIGKQHGVAQRQNRQLARNGYRMFRGRVADVETFVFTTHD